MTENREYLSEKELESIIFELEQSELVPAPQDMLNEILEALEKESPEQKMRKKQEKVIAYKRYRFQVLATVAAAVLAVLLLPNIADLQQQKKNFFKQKYEVEVRVRYETKEEALNDKSLLERAFGKVNIFADNSRLNLFRE